MTTWRVIVPFLALVAAPGARADDAAAIQAVYRDWMVPRAVELVADSARLTRAMEDYCGAPTQDAEAALNRARRSWNASLVDWDRVSAVAIGPVLDYRMQGKLDFTPTRPRMIRKAIKDEPASAADMDRIGTPAKGFPALEWLLWTKPIQPASPECRYAVQVAREIEREAQFMEKTFREAAAAKIDAADAKKALSEFVNQWVGGLDRLRWADMEKPARKAITTGRNGPPEYPRRASGATVVSWAARWEALRALAEGAGPGSLASLLREQGRGQLVDALQRAVERANAAMADLSSSDTNGVLNATHEMTALKRLAEDKVAPALDVRIGFSDSDGD